MDGRHDPDLSVKKEYRTAQKALEALDAKIQEAMDDRMAIEDAQPRLAKQRDARNREIKAKRVAHSENDAYKPQIDL